MYAQKRKRKRVNVGIDYWNALLPNLSDVVREITIDIRNISDRIIKFADELLLFGRDWSNYIITHKELRTIQEEVPFIGIDSSLTPPLRFGPYLLSAVSAVTTSVQRLGEECRKSLNVRMVRAPEKADPSHATNEIKLEMFKMEVRKIQEGISILFHDHDGKGAIFIDGPLVDPPRFPKRPEELEECYRNEYIKDRSEAIKAAIKDKIPIVGIVKRIIGNLLISYLQKSLSEEIAYININDHTLVTLLLKYKLPNILRNSLKLTSGEDILLATKPFELPYDVTDYSNYRENGIYIYFSYILPGISNPYTKVLRIELAFDRKPCEDELKESVWNITKLIAATILPGHSLPLPIILAHRACTIPKSTAKILIREMVSRYFTNAYIQNYDLHVAIDLSNILLG